MCTLRGSVFVWVVVLAVSGCTKGTVSRNDGACSPPCGASFDCVNNTCVERCNTDSDCTSNYCDVSTHACTGALKEPGGKNCGYVDSDNDGIGEEGSANCDHCIKEVSPQDLNDDPDHDGVFGACDVCDGDDAVLDADDDGKCAASCSTEQLRTGAYVLGVCLPDCDAILPQQWPADLCFPSDASAPNTNDNCIWSAHVPDQDSDNDSIPDGCDMCPGSDVTRDTDHDGLCTPICTKAQTDAGDAYNNANRHKTTYCLPRCADLQVQVGCLESSSTVTALNTVTSNPNSQWGGLDVCNGADGSFFTDTDGDTISNACDHCPGDDRIRDSDIDGQCLRMCTESDSPQDIQAGKCTPWCSQGTQTPCGMLCRASPSDNATYPPLATGCAALSCTDPCITDPCPTLPNAVLNPSTQLCCNANGIDIPDSLQAHYNSLTAGGSCAQGVNDGDLDCDGVDGEIEKALFVQCGGGTGSGTKESPYNSIQAALSCVGNAGCVSNKSAIYVAAFQDNNTTPCLYTESLTITAANVVSMYGGYTGDFSSRSSGHLSKVVATSQSPQTPALHLNVVTSGSSAAGSFTISGFQFESTTATESNPTAVAALIDNTTADISLQGNVFVAAPGFRPTPNNATNGADGLGGCAGLRGSYANDSYCNDWDTDYAVRNTQVTFTGCRGTSLNYGGAGANAHCSSEPGGTAGGALDGAAGASINCNGCVGGCSCSSYTTAKGGDGQNASAVTSAGTGGAGNTLCNSMASPLSQCIPPTGTNGSSGSNGGHGGGGAGADNNYHTASGSTGGGGGAAGTAGTGGKSGGSSIALASTASTSVSLSCNIFVSQGGGAGQAGGKGGDGGGGGSGGSGIGGVCVDTDNSWGDPCGGAGGNGGKGSGGSGGGGGAAGHAICLLNLDADGSPLGLINSACGKPAASVGGAAGAAGGGSGVAGLPGTKGADGISANSCVYQSNGTLSGCQ